MCCRRLNRMVGLAGFLLVLALPAVALASGGDGEHGHHLTPFMFDFAPRADSPDGLWDATVYWWNTRTDAFKQFWGAVVNFVLLVFLFRKMSKQPLQGFLDGRRQEVEQGMKEAAELKAKAEAVYNEYNERLKSMDADIEKLRQDIKQAAEADKQRILEEAEAASKRMHAETQTLIARHGEALAHEVRAEVVEAAVKAAQEVLRGSMTSDDQKRLAEQYKQAVASTGGQA